MHYDFDTYYDRRKFHALKQVEMETLARKQGITLPEDTLPLWVADMDFRAPQEFTDCMAKLVAHGIFGYANVPHSHRGVAAAWLKDVHEWTVDPSTICFSGGVIYTAICAILSCTKPGDDILIFEPGYGPLTEIITLHGRNAVVYEISPPRANDAYTADKRSHSARSIDGAERAVCAETSRINFEELGALITPKTTMCILCNPHNPGGYVWTESELSHIAELCLSHGMLICSDDIHADITFSESHYIPIASLSKEVAQATITCLSPSKTFNLGGQKIAYAVVNNKTIFDKIQQVHHRFWGNQPYTNFGIMAFEAVYTYGHAWYRAMLKYIEQNRATALDYIVSHIPEISPICPQSTYLLWMDCTRISTDSNELHKLFVEQGHVFLSQGNFFGSSGHGYMRLNFACPKSILFEGLSRMKRAVEGQTKRK